MGDGINRSPEDHHGRPDKCAGRNERGDQVKQTNISEDSLARMQLIVESAESKMLRKRQQQQQQRDLASKQPASARSGQQSTAAASAGWQLKSAVFARNTLDEDCLRKLATSDEPAPPPPRQPAHEAGEQRAAGSDQVDDLVTNRLGRLIVAEHQPAPILLGSGNPPTQRRAPNGLEQRPARSGGAGAGQQQEPVSASRRDDHRQELTTKRGSNATLGDGESQTIRGIMLHDVELELGCSAENLAPPADTETAGRRAPPKWAPRPPACSSDPNAADKCAAPDYAADSGAGAVVSSPKSSASSSASSGSVGSAGAKFRQPDEQRRQQHRLGSAVASGDSYQRRHSTYMLPIVLNHRRLLEGASNAARDDELNDDDDSDRDDSLSRDSVSLASSGLRRLQASDGANSGIYSSATDHDNDEEDDHDEWSEREHDADGDDNDADDDDDDEKEEEDDDDEDDDDDETRAETARLLATPRAPCGPEGRPPQSARTTAGRLVSASLIRNSASSPSALATPTNDCDCCCAEHSSSSSRSRSRERLHQLLLAGCAGPCCSGGGGPAERLIKLANDKQASGGGQLLASSADAPAANLSCSTTKEPPPFSKGAITDWRQRVAREPSEAAAIGRGRKMRIGSNPLDRLRIFAAPAGDSAGQPRLRPTKLRQQLQPETNNNRGKRHSIISIFSSSGSSTAAANSTAGPNGGHSSQRRRLSCLVGGQANQLGARGPRNSLEGALQFQRRRLQQQPPTVQRLPDSMQAAAQQSYDPLIPESGFKIVVMGTSGSGKTAIIQRFLYDSFNKRHVPTVEDTYFIEFPHMKNLINISISDTSGTYQFPAMRKLAINSSDAFILVYSVDDPKSFDYLEQLRQTILEEREQAYLETCASMTSAGVDSTCSTSCSTSGLGSSSLSNSAASIVSNIGGSASNSSTRQPAYNHPPTVPNHYSAAHHQGAQWQATGDCSAQLPPNRSLVSLFHSTHNQQQYQANSCNNPANINASHQARGSMCSSSSASSSADNSRRSSVSAAEAALRTRRTRRPPMVIVANKHDLPEERHLVNSDEIEALAVIDWNNGFVRASAALNLNVSEIFQEVLRQARQPPTLTEAIVSKRRKSLPPKLH